MDIILSFLHFVFSLKWLTVAIFGVSCDIGEFLTFILILKSCGVGEWNPETSSFLLHYLTLTSSHLLLIPPIYSSLLPNLLLTPPTYS